LGFSSSGKQREGEGEGRGLYSGHETQSCDLGREKCVNYEDQRLRICLHVNVVFSILSPEVENEASLGVIGGEAEALEGVLPQLLGGGLLVQEETLLIVHSQHTRTPTPHHVYVDSLQCLCGEMCALDYGPGPHGGVLLGLDSHHVTLHPVSAAGPRREGVEGRTALALPIRRPRVHQSCAYESVFCEWLGPQHSHAAIP